MKLAIMQPYFLPYIGYFQLINAVNEFVIYDNIKYTKKGWINRNRFLLNSRDDFFTIPLKKDSDYLNVIDRQISDDFNKTKLISQIKAAYFRAPYFDQTIIFFESILAFDNNNLFNFLLNSIQFTCDYLGIKTRFIISSTIDINHELKNQEKVIAICKAQKCKVYLNSIGGLNLYSRNDFSANEIDLKFIKSGDINYKQFENQFVSNLSILDVLMFNKIDKVKEFIINDFEII